MLKKFLPPSFFEAQCRTFKKQCVKFRHGNRFEFVRYVGLVDGMQHIPFEILLLIAEYAPQCEATYCSIPYIISDLRCLNCDMACCSECTAICANCNIILCGSLICALNTLSCSQCEKYLCDKCSIGCFSFTCIEDNYLCKNNTCGVYSGRHGKICSSCYENSEKDEEDEAD